MDPPAVPASIARPRSCRRCGCAPRSCGGCPSHGSKRHRTMRPGSRSTIWSAPGSTSSPMARSAAKAIQTGWPRPFRGSTSTTRRRSWAAPAAPSWCRPLSARSAGCARSRCAMSNFCAPIPTAQSRSRLPGPFTMSRQAKNEFYKDEEELVMDYAAAVNAEIRDLKAAGADVIQLDEPWLQARAEEARRLALPAIDARTRRHRRTDRTAPLLRLRLCRPRQAQRLCVSARAHGLKGRAGLDRSGPAQSRS